MSKRQFLGITYKPQNYKQGIQIKMTVQFL